MVSHVISSPVIHLDVSVLRERSYAPRMLLLTPIIKYLVYYRILNKVVLKLVFEKIVAFICLHFTTLTISSKV